MNKQACPPKQTLIDFLLGKLEPVLVADCEKHLNDCQPCGDTIRSLDCSDTFVNLATEAPLSADGDGSDSEQVVVKMLIDKLEGIGPTRSAETHFRPSTSFRSDDVVSQLKPGTSEDSIGRVAHYEIHGILGHGATSVVFLARDEQLQRDVALKVLRPSLGDEARARFLAEARAAAALNHEHTTTIYEVGNEDHLAYMAQQWLPGETLESRLNQKPELRVDEIKTIATQVAEGLAAAHAKNLIHRDIKPANIWIESERNRAIILDFGLVRVADDTPQMTETGMIAGTPDFMSPEQARGQEVGARSDLFSLGCVMYRLLSGRLPFQASNTLATLQSILNDEPAPVSHLNANVPAELSRLTMMLLSKDASLRPGTANQVATAFKNPTVMRELLDTHTQFSKRLPSKASTLRPWRLGAIAAFVAIAAMIVGGPQIVRVMTNQGVLEIESDDPNIEIEVLKGGKVTHVIDRATGQRLVIDAGNYEIKPRSGASFELSHQNVLMKRGGRVVVTVTKPSGNVGSVAKTSTGNATSAVSDDFAVDQQFQLLNELAEQLQGFDPLDNVEAAKLQFANMRQLIQSHIGKLELRREKLKRIYSRQHPQVLLAENELLKWKDALTTTFPEENRVVETTSDPSELSNVAKFEGKSLDYWLSILSSERSAARIQTAFDALKSLAKEGDSERILDVVFQASRQFESGWSYSVNSAHEVIKQQPPQAIIAAILKELKAKNANSINFIAGINLVQIDFQNQLNEKFDAFQSEIAGIIDKTLVGPVVYQDFEMAVLVYLEWLGLIEEKVDGRANDAAQILQNVVSNLTDPYVAFEAAKFLVENSSEGFTPKIDKLFNRVMNESIEGTPPLGGGGMASHTMPTYVSGVLEILHSVPKEEISQETVDTIIALVERESYWPTIRGVNGETVIPRADAIELLGLFGKRAKGALPTIKKLASQYYIQRYSQIGLGGLDSSAKPNVTPAKAAQAVVRISSPKQIADDLWKMQGKWILASMKSGVKDLLIDEHELNRLLIEGTKVISYRQNRISDGGGPGSDRGALGGAGGAAAESESIVAEIEFTDKPNEFKLKDTIRNKTIFVSFQLGNDQLTLFLSNTAVASEMRERDESVTQKVYKRN